MTTNEPALSFQSITFSDDTTIKLEATDVVVLVGPNNAGKSVALRELQEYVGTPQAKVVLKSAELRHDGTAEDFRDFLSKHAQIRRNGTNQRVSGYKFDFSINEELTELWGRRRNIYHSIFCLRILTEHRINDSDPVDAVDFPDAQSSHPLHILSLDEKVERKISQHFRRAFGQDLILYRGVGRKSRIYVGERLEPQLGEDRASTSYWKRTIDSCVELHRQGDGMRSFASVVLHLLAPSTPTILILDEPEAFLHPPQARLLGEIIATERSSRAQLILATHSPNVLQGLINVAPEHLHVLRMQRDGGVNRVKELDKELVRNISLDPLMKYSSVLSGLFHERVIICEADADCMFYSSILDIPFVNGGRQPDVLFVHANGKHRMASLAETLTALDVPVDIIADIDILNDVQLLEKTVLILGGDWSAIQPLANSVLGAINQSKQSLNVDEIRDAIDDELNKVETGQNLPGQRRTAIERILRKSSAWDAVKEAGQQAIPRGEASKDFRKLQELCSSAGLWIVPVGELEGFCRTIGRKGPAWVRRVLEEYDIERHHELKGARDFIRQVWASRG